MMGYADGTLYVKNEKEGALIDSRCMAKFSIVMFVSAFTAIYIFQWLA